jgi:hypothetical protein
MLTRCWNNFFFFLFLVCADIFPQPVAGLPRVWPLDLAVL